MLIDVVGFELDDAQKMLKQNDFCWELELTESPIKAKTANQQKLRVVRQKILTENKILLTIVKELEKEVNNNGY